MVPSVGLVIATIGLQSSCVGTTECMGHHKLNKDSPLGLASHVTATWPTLCLRPVDSSWMCHKLDVSLQISFCRVSRWSDQLKPNHSCSQPLLFFIYRLGDWQGVRVEEGPSEVIAKATDSSYKVQKLTENCFYLVEKPPVGELLGFVGIGQRQTCVHL